MNELDNKLFIINKASGPTSFQVVEAFRKAARLRKAGHTGTLDPLATGVLLLCSGKATRAVEHFMDLDKRYDFEVRLGVETTTLDAEGEVVREATVPGLSEKDVHATARSFVGRYELDPPAYSALKHNGRRFYEMARAGETPEAKPRIVEIYDLEVVRIALPSVFCRLRCSRGTYVRSIARDFGGKLGLPAHIGGLVRRAVGPFAMEEGFDSERLFAGDLVGLEGVELSRALDFLPGIVIRDASRHALLNGALPGERDVVKTIGAVAGSPTLRILDESGELLAVGSRGAGERKRLSWVDSYRLFVDRHGRNS